jgi:hypothetical protein
MTIACDQREVIGKLNDERISDQKKIIELQDKLIKKKDHEVNSVQKTVGTDLNLYSSALKGSCSATPSPVNITSAIKKVGDADDRKINLVIFGVINGDKEEPDIKVSSVLQQLSEKPQIPSCSRIGKNP